jgi:two-component system, chemotaxis family, chemotaxis protein CheY
MKVIVADDSRVMRNIISNALKPMGFEVLHAANGQEVIEILQVSWNDIGLILLDWNMPIMNGLEVLKEMKQNDQYKNIPALMVSTEAEIGKMDLAFNEGAKGYLAKPFTQDELIKSIDNIIKA